MSSHAIHGHRVAKYGVQDATSVVFKRKVDEKRFSVGRDEDSLLQSF